MKSNVLKLADRKHFILTFEYRNLEKKDKNCEQMIVLRFARISVYRDDSILMTHL